MTGRKNLKIFYTEVIAMTKKEVKIKKLIDIPKDKKNSRDVYVDERDKVEIAAKSLAHEMDKLAWDLSCE